jgi:hypothetical protein
LPVVGRIFHLWLGNRVEPTWPPIASLLDDVRRFRGIAAAGGSNVLFVQRSVMGSSFVVSAGAIEESNSKASA